MKVLVCGPRVWLAQKPIEEALRKLPPRSVLVHGGARGADSIAGFVGEILGFEVREYAVDHDLDGPWPAAGVKRNLRMLASEHPHTSDGSYIDVGIACRMAGQFTRGTGSMVEFMRKATPKIQILEVVFPHRS